VTPFVSVVVPTRNRAGLLPGLLAALDAQDYDGYEVIVVDDASTDATPEILRRWQREGRIVLRQEEMSGSYAARNRGWRAARGEIIAFTDDDCLPESGWLSGLVRAIQDNQAEEPKLGAQGVTLATPDPGGLSITPFTHQIEQRRPGPPYRTCNVAYRRAILEQIGGFDDSLRWYADNILGLRARELGTIGFAPDATVRHPPRPREWRDRAAWRARLAADAKHRRFLYHRSLEPRVPAGALPILLWVLRPLAKQSLAHLRYLARHPVAYGRALPPMFREKRDLLLAMRDYRLDKRKTVQKHELEALPALSDHPLISVVVVSHRPHFLDGLLDALERQTWQNQELVVVSEGCEGAEVAQRHGARYLRGDRSGLGAARELGWRAASGEIVAFTDDDCMPDPRWLETMAAAFATNPLLWGVQGRTEAEAGPVGAHAVRVPGPDPLLQTCNVAYRAAALERAGGFDRRFRGWFEDTAVGARVLEHGPIGFEPRALVTHRAMPRVRRDRATWARVLRDEHLLAQAYPDFYRRVRGRSFLVAVVVRWLVGSPVKSLLRELPRAFEDPRGYLRLAGLLVTERVALLLALFGFLRSQRTP
jgi:glycosyltransferase involved in cell wall biosynthesis